MKRPIRTTRRARQAEGQSLVEFALVFPIFFVLLMGLIEFGLVFNALLSVNFATRDSSLIAAEAGNGVGADCVILKKIEDSIGAPSNKQQITQVEIYKANKTGLAQGGRINLYVRSGSKTCTLPDATTLTVPYSLSGSAGYVEAQRCNVVNGCPTFPGSPNGVDTIGVKITYHYTWFTPMGSFIGLGISDYYMNEANAMRMEPVL
ncbi:MAG: pilus assembly protein [Chloroflexota bacterium]|nr:pilus assembly protein [Chloroflexota bacterium]